MHRRLEPKLLYVLRTGYERSQFASDVVAGLIVGVVALPLAIALAIASGVKPEQGLYTAIVAGFAIAALGGSRAQVSGPTGAFIVVVYGIVQQHGYEGLAVATMLAGLMLVVMGLAGMGAMLKFVPFPVTVGFTAGIALIILSSQVKDFLGLPLEAVPAGFVEKWVLFAGTLESLDPAASAVALGSLAVVVLWPRLTRRVPGTLVAILAATAAVHALGLQVETIGSRFGAMPSGFPTPSLPSLSPALVREMVSPAVTIALLAALESLLSAVVADGMLGTRHRSNMELVAQGVGNVLSPLFGGVPATGAIARTATNIRSGGRTPVAAITHSVFLLAVLLFAGRWAELIPMPALAAVLVVVAYNMSEWRTVRRLLRSPKSDVAVMGATFALTVLVDLSVAIQVGVVLAGFLFLRRLSTLTRVDVVTQNLVDGEDGRFDGPRSLTRREIPPGVEVFEIYGSLFFGAVEHFKDALALAGPPPAVLILRMRDVPAIDASGLESLEELLDRTRHDGTTLVLSGAPPPVEAAMRRSGLLARLGEANVAGDIDAALARAGEVARERCEVRGARYEEEEATDNTDRHGWDRR